QWTFEPQVKWGIAKGCDVRASSAFIGGGGDRAGSGNLRLGGTYQFLKRDPWPVLSLQEFVELPTGLHSAGLDTTTNLLLTQPLGQVKPYRRLHLNATWIHNASPGPTERENRYRLVLGYSQQIFKDTVLVADFVIEQQFAMGENTRLLETGILQKFGKALEVTFGAGAGLGEDSPVVRLGLGVRAKW
ncbi:MAG: hypothetical protein INR62_11760, partial [Rhodospirillales bacterium]|nr:hypothetical protein [Acetobacter sp.]